MPRAPEPSQRGLRLLGRSDVPFPESPDAGTIETFANRFPQRPYVVTFECADFTSLCPITGQPDFARLRIEYVPAKQCLETKSLKFYLAAFRNTRAFNEEVVNRILEDLVAACRPRRLLVQGSFASRGGITLSVDAEYQGRPSGQRRGKGQ